MNTRFLARGAVAVAVAAALSAGYVAGTRRADPQIITPAQAAALMPAEAAAKTGIPDFSAVETYGPAVVNISAKHVVKQVSRRVPQPQLPIDPSDPFYQFFKHFYGCRAWAATRSRTTSRARASVPGSSSAPTGTSSPMRT